MVKTTTRWRVRGQDNWNVVSKNLFPSDLKVPRILYLAWRLLRMNITPPKMKYTDFMELVVFSTLNLPTNSEANEISLEWKYQRFYPSLSFIRSWLSSATSSILLCGTDWIRHCTWTTISLVLMDFANLLQIAAYTTNRHFWAYSKKHYQLKIKRQRVGAGNAHFSAR